MYFRIRTPQTVHMLLHPSFQKQIQEALSSATDLTTEQRAFWQSVDYFLNGQYHAATTTLTELPAMNEQIERLHLLIQLAKFERIPAELTLNSIDVTVAKESAGYALTAEPDRLQFTGDQLVDTQIGFLNDALQAWQLRNLRSLLIGSHVLTDTSRIKILYQRELRQLEGQLSTHGAWAAIQASELCFRANDKVAGGEWLQRAHKLAQQQEDAYWIGSCFMRLGDWGAASNNSSVLFWNFLPKTNSTANSILTSTDENKEARPPSVEQLARSENAWLQAEKLFEQGDFLSGQGDLALRSAYIAFLRSEWLLIVDHARRGCEFFEQAQDYAYVALAKMQIIVGHILLKDFATARNLLNELSSLCKASGNYAWSVALGAFLARFSRHLLLRSGQAELALKTYDLCRTFQKAIHAPFLAAQHLADQGEIYKQLGHATAAITSFEAATDEFNYIIDKEWQGFSDPLDTAMHTRVGLGLLVSDNVLLGMRTQDPDLIDRSIQRMDKLYEQLKPYATPERRQQQSQLHNLLQLYDYQKEQARVLSPLYWAKRLRELGDTIGFETKWQEAYEAVATINVSQQNLMNATVWATKKNWAKAGQAMRTHWTPKQHQQGFMAEMLKVMGQFGAQGESEIARQQYKDRTLAFSSFIRTRQYVDARKYYEELVMHHGEEWWKQEEAPWLSISEVGELYAGEGKYQMSMEAYDLALQQLQNHRSQLSRDELKVTLADSQNVQYIYAYAAKAAIAVGAWDKSIAYAELGKARGLLDLLAENEYLLSDTPEAQRLTFELRELSSHRSVMIAQLANLRTDDQANRPLIEELSEQVAKLDHSYEDLHNKLQDILPVDQRVPREPIDLLSIKNQLPDNTLALCYLTLGDDLLLWAIHKKGVLKATAVKVDDWELMSEVAAMRKAIVQRLPWRNAARVLSQRLLGPFVNELRTYNSLVIVPHGALHSLPFQALLLDDKPVGLQFQISYLPSLSALPFLRGGKTISNTDILVVGNPTGDLPAAALEAEFVGQQYQGEAHVLIGDEATEEKVRGYLPKAKLLHVATHGSFSESAPMLSALSLAKGQSLTLQELTGIQLRADLVVLSACDTGRGAKTGGDDMLGLTRGLIASGARAAVVSLWQVNDLSTSLFMGRFYKALREKIAPIEALRTAQQYLSELDSEKARSIATDQLATDINSKQNRQYLKQSRAGRREQEDATISVSYDHPYYWAAFVLIG